MPQVSTTVSLKHEVNQTRLMLATECTTIASHKSAAIAICGDTDDDDSALTCEDVAARATKLQQTCLGDGVVGGTFTVSPSKEIQIIHS